MIGKQIRLYDIYDLPHGTHVTIAINKNAFMQAVSFGDKFGLQSGEFKTAKDIEDNAWKVFFRLELKLAFLMLLKGINIL